MRKMSKSRTDDDMVSSTNGSGSLSNEEHQEAERSEHGGKEPDDKLNDSDFESEPEKPKESNKKSKAKSKSKKKKSDRSNDKKDAEEEEFEVEKIIDSKRIKGKLHYLIRWKGYSADSDTWEPANTLSCPDLIQKFNEEKENSKTISKNSKKRKAAKKESKSPPKKTKTEWDSKNADENAEYEVERILEVHHKKNGARDFLIHWKGWASQFDSWEPESNLNCPELIKKFMEKVEVARSSESRNLRVAPETTNRFTLQDPSSGRRLSKRRGQRQRVRYDNAE